MSESSQLKTPKEMSDYEAETRDEQADEEQFIVDNEDEDDTGLFGSGSEGGLSEYDSIAVKPISG